MYGAPPRLCSNGCSQETRCGRTVILAPLSVTNFEDVIDQTMESGHGFIVVSQPAHRFIVTMAHPFGKK